ncbi:MAG TPA: hypothetical protein VFQ35_27780 [Polyangiaceae bacterium]|nr:hypothetical protein [Polyangiaceae bacterium]
MTSAVRVSLFRAALLVLGFTVFACYRPTRRECAVLCGDGNQCPDGMDCSNGRCTSHGRQCSRLETDAAPPPVECVPGTTRCASRAAVERCDMDGVTWSQVQACGDETPVCAAGQCLRCTPGSARCIDETSRAVCDETGNFGEPSRCPAGANSCVNAECTPKLQVAAGGAHACAKLASGRVFCWGENSAGQLGVGDRLRRRGDPSDLPLEAVELGSPALSVVTGGAHTCALLEGGVVKCWGENAAGQLGQGDVERRGDEPGEMARLRPVDLGAARTAVSLTAGDRHTCALLDDGTVKCWGANESGQLGVSGARHRGGAPFELGERLTPLALDWDTVVVAIDAGAAHTCAALADGSVVCWGDNSAGQLGIGAANGSDGALQSGRLVPRVILGAERRAVGVAAGADHSCALIEGGSVVCWGNNDAGQLGVGDAVSRGRQPEGIEAELSEVELGSGAFALAVSAGARHTCVLLAQGAVKCWGSNAFGALGLGRAELNRGVMPSDLGDALLTVDLGSRQSGARAVSGLSAGLDFTCAVLEDEAIKCWGLNAHGQLGLGDSRNRGLSPGELGELLPEVVLE